MDLLERVFHVAPDGGDGATEALYVVAVVVLCATLAIERLRRDRARRRPGDGSW